MLITSVITNSCVGTSEFFRDYKVNRLAVPRIWGVLIQLDTLTGPLSCFNHITDLLLVLKPPSVVFITVEVKPDVLRGKVEGLDPFSIRFLFLHLFDFLQELINQMHGLDLKLRLYVVGGEWSGDLILFEHVIEDALVWLQAEVYFLGAKTRRILI